MWGQKKNQGIEQGTAKDKVHLILIAVTICLKNSKVTRNDSGEGTVNKNKCRKWKDCLWWSGVKAISVRAEPMVVQGIRMLMKLGTKWKDKHCEKELERTEEN